MKKLLIIGLLSIAFSGFSQTVLPFARYSGDSTVRLTLGGYAGFSSTAREGTIKDSKSGLTDLGGGIGIATAFLDILEVGIEARLADRNLVKLYDDAAKNFGGMRYDINGIFRVALPIFSWLDLGAFVGTGVGLGRSKFEIEQLNDSILPGWSLDLGPFVRINISELASVYAGIGYTLRNIKFSEPKTAVAKYFANQNGLTIPVGAAFHLGEHLSIYGQVDTALENLSAPNSGYKGFANLGLGYAF